MVERKTDLGKRLALTAVDVFDGDRDNVLVKVRKFWILLIGIRDDTGENELKNDTLKIRREIDI